MNGRLCPGAEVELDHCIVKECPCQLENDVWKLNETNFNDNFN